MVRNLIRAKKEGQDEIHLAPLSGNLMDRHSPPKNDQNISLFGGNVKSGKRESSPPYFHAFHQYAPGGILPLIWIVFYGKRDPAFLKKVIRLAGEPHFELPGQP